MFRALRGMHTPRVPGASWILSCFSAVRMSGKRWRVCPGRCFSVLVVPPLLRFHRVPRAHDASAEYDDAGAYDDRSHQYSSTHDHDPGAAEPAAADDHCGAVDHFPPCATAVTASGSADAVGDRSPIPKLHPIFV